MGRSACQCCIAGAESSPTVTAQDSQLVSKKWKDAMHDPESHEVSAKAEAEVSPISKLGSLKLLKVLPYASLDICEVGYAPHLKLICDFDSTQDWQHEEDTVGDAQRDPDAY